MEIDQLESFLILYMQSRNAHQWGWCGYKVYKALFTYITGIRDIDSLRNIFEKILKKGYFQKRRINTKTDYRFIFNVDT